MLAGEARDPTDDRHPRQEPQVADGGPERQVDGPEILFHGFGLTFRRVSASGRSARFSWGGTTGTTKSRDLERGERDETDGEKSGACTCRTCRKRRKTAGSTRQHRAKPFFPADEASGQRRCRPKDSVPHFPEAFPAENAGLFLPRAPNIHHARKFFP